MQFDDAFRRVLISTSSRCPNRSGQAARQEQGRSHAAATSDPAAGRPGKRIPDHRRRGFLRIITSRRFMMRLGAGPYRRHRPGEFAPRGWANADFFRRRFQNWGSAEPCLAGEPTADCLIPAGCRRCRKALPIDLAAAMRSVPSRRSEPTRTGNNHLAACVMSERRRNRSCWLGHRQDRR